MTKFKTEKAIKLNKKRAESQMRIFLGVTEHQSRRQAWHDIADRVIPDDSLDASLGAVSKLAKLGQAIADRFVHHPDRVLYHIGEILKLGTHSEG